MSEFRYTHSLGQSTDSPLDALRLGGKGASLVRLASLSVRTPEGIGVTIDAFWEYLESIGARSQVNTMGPRLGDADFDTAALAAVRQQVIEGSIPPAILNEVLDRCGDWPTEQRGSRLIVRSSATVEDSSAHSYAGIFSSLVVDGLAAVEAAMKEVWASVFATRATSYYQLTGLGEFPAMALIVQPFLEADRSGVMFTEFRSPDDTNCVLIEHVEGDCEKLVSGEANPLRLWIPRWASADDDAVTDRATLPLPGRIVFELTRLGRKLEDRFGSPQDVEWCLCDDQLYVVQARPITGRRSKPKSPARREDRTDAILSGVPASGGRAGGVAHLVLSVEDAATLQPGEVLVATMTNPDMVTAMRNSSAVVTDVGGMICHAAIVSRELGIPCIVGTERATSVIRAGDALTVDGDDGKVYAGYSEAAEVEMTTPSLITWEDLWSDWREQSPGLNREVVPWVSTIQALEYVPEALNQCVLLPYIDLVLNEQAQAVALGELSDTEQDGRLEDYFRRVSEIARKRDIGCLAILPLHLDGLEDRIGAALRTTTDDRLTMLRRVDKKPAPTRVLTAVADNGMRWGIVVDPSRDAVASVRPNEALAIPLSGIRLTQRTIAELATPTADGSKEGVFGRVPTSRRSTMPDPDRRAPYHALIPTLGAIHHRRVQPANQSFDWLDLRPEVPVTPILKSLVLGGMETVPATMGFDDLEPLYVKWIRCRFHFRKDTFLAVWAKLQQAVWDESFLAAMLRRTHDSYQALEEAAKAFPESDSEWQGATNDHLRACLVPWLHAFVEFFAESFFIQALGDDCLFPEISQVVGANLTTVRRAGMEEGGGWPGISELTAPTTPVLTADYMADLVRLKQALAEAGCTTMDQALTIVQSESVRGEAPRKARSAVSSHLADWYWMRSRDPYYEPYDQLGIVLEKALGVQDAPAPNYAENIRRNVLALSLHFDLAQASEDPTRLVYAVRYGHALSADRENHHVVWLKHSYPFRKLCLEWERRLGAVCDLRPNDIFFMEVPEVLDAVDAVPDAPSADLLERVRNRRLAFEREARLGGDTSQTLEPVDEDDYY